MTKFYLLLFFIFFYFSLYAQEAVFPGDANANRIIDQYDLLSIGYAFGTSGPARIQDGGTQIQGIPLFWDQTFPSGINYIHSDCNGNGLVDYLDFISLINNLGLPLDTPSPLTINTGISGIDPTTVWNNNISEVAAFSNNILNIPIALPLSDQQSVNGLAFNLRYNPDYFQLISFSTEGHWLEMENQAMSMVKTENEVGLIKVGTTRFNIDPINGGGDIGILHLIIIEDLLCFLESPDDTIKTKIYLEDILMVDESFNPIPVASDTFCIKLYHDITSTVNAPNSNELQASVFPNPSNGLLQLKSRQAFNTVELIDAMGRNTVLYAGIPRKQWETKTIQLTSGIYTIRLRGENGTSTLKYLVTSNKL